MSYVEDCKAARRELLVAREVTRQRELAKPLSRLIDEVLAGRARRTARNGDLVRQAWGAPPTRSSFGRGEAGRPGPRNIRYT
jgi:hypothetical protein